MTLGSTSRGGGVSQGKEGSERCMVEKVSIMRTLGGGIEHASLFPYPRNRGARVFSQYPLMLEVIEKL